MKRILDFDEFLNESEIRILSKKYLLDNFSEVPNNSKLYDPKESDFQDLPWYKAIRSSFPEFKMTEVRDKRIKYPDDEEGEEDEDGYEDEELKWKPWDGNEFLFSVPAVGSRGPYEKVYRVLRPGNLESPSTGPGEIYYGKGNLTFRSDLKEPLNDKKAWNQIFKYLYFAQFADYLSPSDPGKSINKIMDLFSFDLKELYENGDLGIVGVKKNCSPYAGHYKSTLEFLKNLPYGIYEKIKKEFIKKIEENPEVIQYAISQCQLPDSSSEKIKNWGARKYPENEVLDFYNHLKEEGYVPPKGFEDETKEISDLHKSLGDIGL
jgi:hypothetical protein